MVANFSDFHESEPFHEILSSLKLILRAALCAFLEVFYTKIYSSGQIYKLMYIYEIRRPWKLGDVQ